MLKRSRNLFKRQFARLKKWVTLGTVGITPRLAIAFAGVATLAAAANLIVENGVSILEQQRTVEMERNASALQAITTLRESMGRAEQVVYSAELSMALGRFDKAVQAHVAADSRAGQPELRLLEEMREELNIDRLAAAAIERGARARHMIV
jgi:hypothetical protein